MDFSPTELVLLITAIVTVGGFLLQMRVTSFTQVTKINDVLSARIDRLEKSNDDKDKRIESLENELETQVRQNDNFKRYIARLIAQLQRANIVPEIMDDYDR